MYESYVFMEVTASSIAGAMTEMLYCDVLAIIERVASDFADSEFNDQLKALVNDL